MTTIAYRDGVLAGDRLTSARGTIYGHATKVERHPAKITKDADYLFAATGDTAICQAFRTWCRAGMKKKDRPPMKVGESEATGLVYRRFLGVTTVETFEATGSYVLELPWVIREGCMERDFHAVGSGSEYAFGALASGANAQTAVEAAACFDRYTGGGVDVVQFEGQPEAEE